MLSASETDRKCQGTMLFNIAYKFIAYTCLCHTKW